MGLGAVASRARPVRAAGATCWAVIPNSSSSLWYAAEAPNCSRGAWFGWWSAVWSAGLLTLASGPFSRGRYEIDPIPPGAT